MLHDPTTGRGFISWGLLGLGAAVVALLVGSMFPALIPARAASVKL